MKAKSRQDLGAYTPTEAAHYLRLPRSTLSSWVLGQKARKRKFLPVIEIADSKNRLLSFTNLVEAHVLSSIRKIDKIPMPKIRGALKSVENRLGTKRPLLNQLFLSDGLDLFVEHFGSLLNITKGGQTAMRDLVKKYIHRIERDPKGIPIKLYPFSRKAGEEDDRKIMIDPNIAYGRPVLVGTGIPTLNVFDRFQAGESLEDLAHDFKVDGSLIEEAIRCEQVHSAA